MLGVSRVTSSKDEFKRPEGIRSGFPGSSCRSRDRQQALPAPLEGPQHSRPVISGVNLREIGQEIQELLGGSD